MLVSQRKNYGKSIKGRFEGEFPLPVCTAIALYHKPGMTKERAVQDLRDMVDNSSLGADIVAMIIHIYDLLDSVRMNAQAEESLEYQEYKQYQECMK